MAPATTSSSSQDWPAHSFRSAREELALFAWTLRQILRGPKRFAAAWADGELQALNPLAFYFTSLAFVTPYRAAVASLMGAQGSSSIWVNVGKPIASLLPLGLLALIIHAVLRFSGSQRRVASTLGVVLYMAGGPGALAACFAWPVGLFHMVHPEANPGWLAVAGFGTVLLAAAYYALCARALQGLHGVRWWWLLAGVGLGIALVFPVTFWLEAFHPALLVGLMS